ncbi:MAG: phosphoribosylformylglycinamidine synthase I [Promethearchaeati archaeon SRVP18_Atabeyarchaeia-1]
MLKVAIIDFPGSNCRYDTLHVLKDVLRVDARLIWHKEFNDHDYDIAILPGGFSYGDHLRAGIIAAFSPALKSIRRMAADGKPVLGICNGFQILVESGLLPGALLRNSCLTFVCKWIYLRVENNKSPLTRSLTKGAILSLPIAHGEGRYFIDEEAMQEMKRNNQIVFKYVDKSGETTDESNPNGALDNIAGICNTEGNVAGLMPHPERSSERILSPNGTEDGLSILRSMIEFAGGDQ